MAVLFAKFAISRHFSTFSGRHFSHRWGRAVKHETINSINSNMPSQSWLLLVVVLFKSLLYFRCYKVESNSNQAFYPDSWPWYLNLVSLPWVKIHSWHYQQIYQHHTHHWYFSSWCNVGTKVKATDEMKITSKMILTPPTAFWNMNIIFCLLRII